MDYHGKYVSQNLDVRENKTVDKQQLCLNPFGSVKQSKLKLNSFYKID